MPSSSATSSRPATWSWSRPRATTARCSALRDMGADILAIPLEPDGIDVERSSGRSTGGPARSSPTSSPTSTTRPAARSRSRSAGACSSSPPSTTSSLFEDDPYVELRFEGESLPTMLSLDESERVVYASSFSKTVCPGIRVGYLVGPEATIGRSARWPRTPTSRRAWSPQAIVAEFCRSGRDRRLDRDREGRAARAPRRPGRRARARAARRAASSLPEGGYFLWVDLPDGTDGEALHAAAKERGLVFVEGNRLPPRGGESSLRIAYSGVGTDDIEEGVSRLAAAYAEL